MARTIKSRVSYQITQLTENLTQAQSTQSNQKRDFHTSQAMYNAKRLAELVNDAKIGA
jgi:hypothetical protein